MRLRAINAAVCGLVLSVAAQALEFREEPYRVGIVDVGQPILLDDPELTNEMNLNIELRDWIEAFGRPEYAEYQKIALSDPFYPYEIRLYYIEGRSYVAFGRVNVSPAVIDYGVRKYVGKLDSALLQRLLTARPLHKSPAIASARETQYGSPLYGSATTQGAATEPVVENVVVEEVVEIISPDTVIIENAETAVIDVAAEAPEFPPVVEAPAPD